MRHAFFIFFFCGMKEELITQLNKSIGLMSRENVQAHIDKGDLWDFLDLWRIDIAVTSKMLFTELSLLRNWKRDREKFFKGLEGLEEIGAIMKNKGRGKKGKAKNFSEGKRG